jgi:hypothetical protein
MRFLSRIRPARRFASHIPLPLLLLLAMVASSACENKHIGRPCELAITDDGGSSGGGTNATIDVGLECPARICLLPAAEQTAPGTTSLCTADCSSDDDCADGELRNRSDPTDFRCVSGFTCQVAVTVGNFCCRKLCVCKDFVIPTTKRPAVCDPTPANKANCQNI